MKCVNHPDVEAEGMCVYCGKPFCKDCLIQVKGKMYCKDDIGNVIDDAKNSSVSAAMPTINISNSNDSANLNTNTNVNTNAGIGFAPRKKKIVALILCILGAFGIAGFHRIYVGKVGTGIIYLFTFGLCGFGTLIDLISIIVGGFKDSFGQPLV